MEFRLWDKVIEIATGKEFVVRESFGLHGDRVTIAWVNNNKELYRLKTIVD